MSASPPRYTNHLGGESSPYLLQHAHNLVDWYPWGPEAFEKAKRENRPIFLSIGYSTCHWCHVMERESFENEPIAGLLNENFVAIKVDREERPDIDNVYMTACQLMTHSGGWPLTVILTPEGNPWFAGTYFPPDTREGMTGLDALLPRLSQAWKSQRREVDHQATEVAEAVRRALDRPPTHTSTEPLDAQFSRFLLTTLEHRFDPTSGGFGGPPQFPPHGALRFLLFEARQGRQANVDTMLRKTLDEMERGAIFDQVGGGFHRYTVDGQWKIPHFEKMLYDNAQLLETYAGAARVYSDASYRQTAERTVEWLEHRMRTPEGAYASALDADSEGEEGKFYFWTATEIEKILGKDEAPLYLATFDISPAGESLPRLVRPLSPDVEKRIAADNARLEAARARRTSPFRDDTVITSWNALTISALAHASHDLGEPRYLRIAERITDFLLKNHVRGEEVYHASLNGKVKVGGFLDDYADLASALLDVTDAGGPAQYRARAREIAAAMVTRFYDTGGGGFYSTASSGQRGLLEISRDFPDQTTPSPNGTAVEVLRRLDRISPNRAFEQAAATTLAAAAPYVRAFPSAAATWAILAANVETSGDSPLLPSSKTSGPVDVSIRLNRKSARPGETLTGVLRIATEKGWHVTGMTVEWTLPAGVTAGAPVFPPPHEIVSAGEKLQVYSGTVEAPFDVVISRNAQAAPAPLAAFVSFQPCDNTRCLAPSRVEVGVTLNVEP